MKTKRMVIMAMLVALHVVLSYFSINLGNMKITVSGITIVVAAMLMGPVAGVLVGLTGSFITQILTYGLTPTTVLWILPAGFRGLSCGLYAKHFGYRLNAGQMLLITCISSLGVTAINTVVMYIDSKLYGYYSWGYVFGAIVPRIVSGLLVAVVFVVITMPVLNGIRRSFDTSEIEEHARN